MGFWLSAVLITGAVILPVLVGEFIPATLTLERAFPANHRVEVSELVRRDRVRHGRILQTSSNGVVEFLVGGTYNPYVVGLYYTRVQLGSPPTDFYVQIDTGSDVLWVSCASCNGCPQTSGLQIPLNFFDTGSSSTSSLVSCSDKRCSAGFQSSDSACSSQSNQCTYAFQYGDGSGSSGYYVSDLLHLDSVLENSTIQNSSAPILFGCSTSVTGDLTKTDRAVGGIFGFGQQSMSVISQLSSQGVAPKAFSHCLRGDNAGGGILVLGEIVDSNIVYSPLVSQQPHYNLNLQSISVNGQTLSIDPTVFATSSNRGTIIDSGTTLAYLAEEAYEPFVNAINTAVSQSVGSSLSNGSQCYSITASPTDIFPQVNLNFADNASMVLRPQDYLLQQNSNLEKQKIGGNAAVWCIGFQKISGQKMTILGDLVLKDKIVVYDLAGQRIGWANYDCSMSVNVSTTSSTGKTQSVNSGQLSEGSSFRNKAYNSLPLCILAFFLHVAILWTFQFL